LVVYEPIYLWSSLLQPTCRGMQYYHSIDMEAKNCLHTKK
jgi:hypothetical protein